MSVKKSFNLFFDSLDVLDDLTDEQAGQLFKAIRAYEINSEEILEGLMKAVFVPFKHNSDRNKTKYVETCNRNRANGMSGGRPRKDETQNNPVGFSETHSNPKKPDKDKDKDKDKEEKKEKKKPSTISSEFAKSFYDHLSLNGGKQKYTTKDIMNGAEEVDKLVRIDSYCIETEIIPALKWGLNDPFWSGQIRSLAQIRKKSKNGEIKFTNLFSQYSARGVVGKQNKLQPRNVREAQAIQNSEIARILNEDAEREQSDVKRSEESRLFLEPPV